MYTRAWWAVLFGMGVLSAPFARADIYTWVDASGVMNVSNLPPPENVRHMNVVRAAPKEAQDAAFREAAREAEMRALNERVQQLQADVERSRRETASLPTFAAQSPMQYAPAQPAPYVIVVSPPAPAYPETASGCNYAWGNCGLGFWPGFYPSGVVVLHDRQFRHGHRHHHGHAHHHGRGFNQGGSRFPSPSHAPPLVRTSIRPK